MSQTAAGQGATCKSRVLEVLRIALNRCAETGLDRSQHTLRIQEDGELFLASFTKPHLTSPPPSPSKDRPECAKHSASLLNSRITVIV